MLAGPLNVTPLLCGSGGQALSCQLLSIVPVLVDLCQRADKTGPLVVSWNCNLLCVCVGGGEEGGKRRRGSRYKQVMIHTHSFINNKCIVTSSNFICNTLLCCRIIHSSANYSSFGELCLKQHAQVIRIIKHTMGNVMLPAYLSNVINKHSSLRVSHGNFSARIGPSDPVQGRVSLHCDTGRRNLKTSTSCEKRENLSPASKQGI